MDDSTVKEIANGLFKAHQSRATYAPLPSDYTDQPLEQAYRVQDEFNRLLSANGVGEQVGYKVALTSAAMQAFVGVGHPLAGVVFASRRHMSPSTQSVSDYIHVGVEFEVTVRLGQALTKGAQPHTRESVAGAIATCAASYELVEDRAADLGRLTAFQLIAENSWNAGFICGTEVSDFAGVDFEQGKTQLWIDGEAAGEGKIGDALGHPFEAVAWLANLLNGQGRQLEADMVVMTGSSITTRFPEPGQHYKLTVEGLGDVEINWTR